MKHYKLLLIFLVFLIPDFSQAFIQPKKPNVILITLDGVRWKEFFYGVDPVVNHGPNVGSTGEIFSYFWKAMSPFGVTFGDRNHGSTAMVSNASVKSLPAYQSMMAGFVQPGCLTNDCGRIQVETLQERLVRELGFAPKEVASIASWETMPLAIEHVQGATFTNASVFPLVDGETDEELAKLNHDQQVDIPPWTYTRYDKYTMAHALRYLKKHSPRFLYISLNDTDDLGHLGEYEKYVNVMRDYDVWLKEMISTLDQMGEYGKSTTIIMTTDHGRGDGDSWKHHAASIEPSKYIWLYGQSPYTRSHPHFGEESVNAGTLFLHTDLRATIEASFGLKPFECKTCGHVIKEITGN